MPEGFVSSADVPLQEKVGGEWVEFPMLSDDVDLPTLGRRLQQERAEKAMAGLPLNAGAERQQISQYYADNEPDVDALAAYVFTLPGTRAVLTRSLARTDRRQDADRIIKALARERGWRDVVRLAAEVSGLFPPRQRDAQGRVPVPNAPGGATGASPSPAEATAPTTESAASSPNASQAEAA
jgi:hypothetical protein